MPDRKIVVGGPGCGKTTFVAKMLRGLVEKYGHERAAVVTSLTKAGAREIAARDTGLHHEMAGTLHSFCYRGLQGPKIVEPKHLEEWTVFAPLWSMHKEILGRGGFAGEATMGDIAYQESQVLRARRVPRDQWPENARNFDERWSNWLEETGRMDYQGLIDKALTDLPFLPVKGNVEGIVVDEAQDLSRSEMDLLSNWSERGGLNLCFCGDPYQSLYTWRGADQSILAGKPWRVLEQSYRVPAPIHELAMGMIGQISVQFQDYGYLAAEHEGKVQHGGAKRKHFGMYLDEIEKTLETEGETLMILCAFSRHLIPVISHLRSNGVPYGNPWNDSYNPLRTKAARGVASFLAGKDRQRWSIQQLREWLPMIGRPFFKKRGVKLALSGLNDSDSATRFLMEWVEEKKRHEIFDSPGPAWLLENVIPSRVNELDYPLAVYRKHGIEGLARKPRIIPSTIHGAKGAEADVVVLFPDLAPAQARKLQQPGWEGADEMIRAFYVAITRARRKLILGQQSGTTAQSITSVAPFWW